MNTRKLTFLMLSALVAAGCGQKNAEEPTSVDESAAPMETSVSDAEAMEIVPGLTARILKVGSGDLVAQPGQDVTVHYTGWLYDPAAENGRGQKFDSSVDRGEHFGFELGAGRVIRGWDAGVAGMKIGEVRELTIAPELAYGNRAIGDLIPAGSTLVFEVELFEVSGEAAAGE